jgi:hypothetical protein
MSSPTPVAILELENQAKNFIPEAAECTPSTFLSLAPTTSASYPQRPKSKLTSGALAQVPVSPELKQRTSSMSSDRSAGFRFLRLGPVHWGEHQDDNKTDWNDVVVE